MKLQRDVRTRRIWIISSFISKYRRCRFGIGSDGLFTHRPPPNYPQKLSKKQLQSAPTYQLQGRPHQDNWFKSYFIDWIFIIAITPWTATTKTSSGGNCVTAFGCTSFLFPARIPLSCFCVCLAKGRCFTIINRFEATEKLGRSIERLLNGKLVRSVLRFAIHFLFCSFAAHQIEHGQRCTLFLYFWGGWFRALVIAIMNFLSFILHRHFLPFSFFQCNAWINSILLSVRLQFIHLVEFFLISQSNLSYFHNV